MFLCICVFICAFVVMFVYLCLFICVCVWLHAVAWVFHMCVCRQDCVYLCFYTYVFCLLDCPGLLIFVCFCICVCIFMRGPVSCVLSHHMCVWRQLKEATSALPQPCSNLMTHIWYQHHCHHHHRCCLHHHHQCLFYRMTNIRHMRFIVVMMILKHKLLKIGSLCQCWWYGGEMNKKSWW